MGERGERAIANLLQQLGAVVAEVRSARITRVLVKKPISGSSSTRPRLATGVPTSTVSCPE